MDLFGKVQYGGFEKKGQGSAGVKSLRVWLPGTCRMQECESLRVWLPGTCRIQEWRFSEFGCQGPAVCRSGESQSLTARDLPYTGVESLRV